jgi:ABC-type transport system substrate-binding protein
MTHTRAIVAAALALATSLSACQEREAQKPADSSPPTTPAAVPAAPSPTPSITPEAAAPQEPTSTAPAARPAEVAVLTESQKIERMLVLLNESDAVFIRNGVDYDGKAAASHLRRKWSAAGDRISTASEFIDALATKSSASGKAYQIRLNDGSTVPSAEWFRQLLAAVEAGK